MVSNTLSPCRRVPCRSSHLLLFLLLHSDDIKPGWDPSMLTVHLQKRLLFENASEDSGSAYSLRRGQEPASYVSANWQELEHAK